jgi:hypothetical protein
LRFCRNESAEFKNWGEMVISFEWRTMAIGIARDPYGLRQLGQYRGKGDSMIEGELLQKNLKCTVFYRV